MPHRSLVALSWWVVASALLAPNHLLANEPPPYTVVEGSKVDAKTLQGFRTWRAAACDRCHGANQEGLVGPSLIESLKTMNKSTFTTVIASGRPEKGMPGWSTNPSVMNNVEALYAYLKGRSDGAITKAKVEPMP
ncbi:MAG: methanol dehydrogenase [Ideonella sp. MAG2]|nr:MAG: methanol dehydrogenase [Ideonella sp. MAG2]